MAKVVLNPALQVLSGDVGGFVYRQQADGSVVVAKQALPDPNREPSEAQLEQMQKFKEASARYRRLMEDEDVQAAYEKLVKERGLRRLRALVIGDILRAPKVSTVDMSNYHGEVGDTIRVIAEDSVGVSRLTLSISDVTSNQVVESAEMAMNGQVSGTVEWVYTSTAAVQAGHEVKATVKAYDLAGNVMEVGQTA
ncbi:MAG: hypothetical protein HY865_04710 [Chloroflexi bacterium]|nr:hypothetical protein [Chloroflexota bacterium]